MRKHDVSFNKLPIETFKVNNYTRDVEFRSAEGINERRRQRPQEVIEYSSCQGLRWKLLYSKFYIEMDQPLISEWTQKTLKLQKPNFFLTLTFLVASCMIWANFFSLGTSGCPSVKWGIWLTHHLDFFHFLYSILSGLLPCIVFGGRNRSNNTFYLLHNFQEIESSPTAQVHGYLSHSSIPECL